MRYSTRIKEAQLINEVRADFFAAFDTTKMIGNIDFAVSVKDGRSGFQPLVETRFIASDGAKGDAMNRVSTFDTDYLLWAEAKRGTVPDILQPLAQLVHTIGKERTFEKHLPPKYLAAFDAEKIALIEYHRVADIFNQNDFNWNTAPNDHTTREHEIILKRLAQQSGHELIRYSWAEDEKDIRRFIAANFKSGRGTTAKIKITRNNFTAVYAKWRREVKASIAIDWDAAKKSDILDADFFLADVLSDKNKTLADKLLFVLLKGDHYEFDHRRSNVGGLLFQTVDFTDGGTAHAQFWNRYERPPKKEYWDYIVERRDLLVPQDVREVKGAFFTPSRWVELSQQYLADTLGEDWQSEYVVWDCCAGTGNLLAGLTEPARIYASTLDPADVKAMHDRIKNGANLLPGNVFQFDFLNDDLFGEKVPPTLRAILADPEKRKKLLIYINPPYKEAGNKRAITTEEQGNNPDVAKGTSIGKKYKPLIGPAANELFAQFLIRIHQELQCCKLAQFATLKALCAPNFARFRSVFQSRLLSLFLMPGDTFDNVDGDFPIGFFVWDLAQREPFTAIDAHVYDSKANRLPDKCVFAPPAKGLWMDWVKSLHDKQGERIAYFSTTCSDFQHQNLTFLTLTPSANDFLQHRTHDVTTNNFLAMMVAMAVRLVPKATWLNDRDQFLYPSDSWAEDIVFQNDCLIYTLFHGQNRISASGNSDFSIRRFVDSSIGEGQIPFSHSKSRLIEKSKNPLPPISHSKNRLIEKSKNPLPPNHWIPFTETEVGAQSSFASHFVSDFLHGRRDAIHRVSTPTQSDLFAADKANRKIEKSKNRKIIETLTPAARAVYSAGLALWRYYHATASSHQAPSTRHQAPYLPNASFYDIRAYFQGFTNGKMNADSHDEAYNVLIAALRAALRALASQIEPRIYAHGFLRR